MSITNQNGQLEFEDKLWLMADKLRNNIDAAEYKHVVLGLLFLKYISDAFEEQYEKLSKEEYADPEDRDEYAALNIFWVPKEARMCSSEAEYLLHGEHVPAGGYFRRLLICYAVKMKYLYRTNKQSI